ncbi:MAG: DUF3667 domain-containing protein [Chitinophagaceae bacterium]|nr:DUF3667 domain-containing protein [Chitinophagaceae bacterium]
MSRLKERKEKNCLNCQAEVMGKYCHVCGQENIEPKESVWHLVTHFFQDITHFDGKFFSTIRYLIVRPGFLSTEYMIGRRASYVNPVRLYVFTSAFFFLIFFSVFKLENSIPSGTTINGKTLEQISSMDSTRFAEFTRQINQEDGKPALSMTREGFARYFDSVMSNTGIRVSGRFYKTLAAYDSALSSGTVKDNWIQQQLIRKVININNKYHYNSKEVQKAFRSSILHSLPQMLFISLPLLALWLKLLYRRRKEYYYVNHAIYAIHLYIFSFLSLLFFFSINKINDQLHWGFLGTLMSFIYLGLFVYQYVSMYKFYRQGWGKTLVKFLLLNILFLITLALLFIAFVFLSLFNI